LNSRRTAGIVGTIRQKVEPAEVSVAVPLWDQRRLKYDELDCIEIVVAVDSAYHTKIPDASVDCRTVTVAEFARLVRHPNEKSSSRLVGGGRLLCPRNGLESKPR
jgi:hypothetical protein